MKSNLFGAAARIMALCALLISQVQAAPRATIAIDAGRIDGVTLASGVQAYFGIPYVAPPVRDLRWKAPQPVAPWAGVFHADRKGAECIQLLRRKDINHYFGEEATSEDCLFLNVWAPAKAKPGASLPVVVFIHGGGFTLGSSGMALYGGENVARSNGAIFVNFNYRVGILGFLAHPELSAESPHHASGNYGFLDQVAALDWIQRNIARFGGNPDNVTITGQSAGGGSVLALVASPLAKGKFHRAVIMSGGGPGNNYPSLAESEKTGLEAQAALGETSIAAMRQLPADRVFSIQRDFQFGPSGSVSVRPNIDGHFLPDQIGAIFAAGRQNDVPTIAGLTADDISSSTLQKVTTLAQFHSESRAAYGENTELFLKLYPAANDEEASRMGRLSARHAVMEKGARALGLAQRSSGKAPFYMYVFSHAHPINPAARPFDNPTGAYHTSDVPFWFQTQDALNLFRPTRLWNGYDRELANRMTQSLLAFARSGNPATQSMAWPQWSIDNPRHLDLGDRVSVEQQNSDQMNFHKLPAQYLRPGMAPLRTTRD